MRKPKSIIRNCLWARCRIAAKGKTFKWYWAAWWTCSPFESADAAPDASGVCDGPTLAEQAAKSAIGAVQTDWRYQVVETVESVAAAQAELAGHRWDPVRDKKREASARRQAKRVNQDMWGHELADIMAELRRLCDEQRIAERLRNLWREQQEKRAREAFSFTFVAPEPDPFPVLGLSSKATAAEVKAAYRKLVFKAHPDHGGSDAEFIKLTNAFRRCQAATEGT